MKVTKELNLRNFEFWSGALELAELLTNEELDLIESCLEDLYSARGLKETEINDLFWHEKDFICNLIGETAEEVLERE